MKYLNSRLIRILVILFTLINSAFLYWRLSIGETPPNAIADFFILEILLITLYVIYISCVVWVNESIADLKYRLVKLENNIESLRELSSVVTQQKQTIQKLTTTFEKKTNGLNDVLYSISQENEVFRSKLLRLQNSNDASEKFLNDLQANLIKYLNIIKTELQKEQSALGENIDAKHTKLSEKIVYTLNSRLNKEEKELATMADNIKNQNYYNYNRIDALFSIHQLIKLRSPLPIMHDWAISSDYAHFLLRTILNKGNGNIIDIGSGISTILLGYAVERNGSGKVISLEHDKDYYSQTLALIKEHKLEKYIDLNYCPLIDVDIDGKSWIWYDISEVDFPRDIVLISVDGPPGNTQKLARYPAVPLLKNHIKKGTTILLDDAKRTEEDEIADLWSKEQYLSKEFIDGYKGIFKLEK